MTANSVLSEAVGISADHRNFVPAPFSPAVDVDDVYANDAGSLQAGQPVKGPFSSSTCCARQHVSPMVVLQVLGGRDICYKIQEIPQEGDTTASSLYLHACGL